MKTALFATVLSLAVSLVSAGIVITPITDDQIVDKLPGDCPFGVVTPQGCGYVLIIYLPLPQLLT